MAAPVKSLRSRPRPQRAVRGSKARVRRARGDLYRRLILEAAEKRFAERGVEESSMEAIAKEAGLSLGTLYSVFVGKAEIVRAIHEMRLGEVLQRAIEAGRHLTAPLEALLAGVRAYVEFFIAHPSYLRMHLRDGYSWAIASGSTGTRVQADAWEEGISMQGALFEKGVADGTFYDGQPLVMAKMMVAMQQVQLATWVDGGMASDPESLISEIEEQVRRSFCPPRKTR